MAKQHWWSRRPDPDPVLAPEVAVIGTQRAAASAAEAQHRTVDHGPSPLAGVSYQPEDHDLLRLSASDVDEVIAAVVEAFAGAQRAERVATTARLTMEDQYRLVTFARRCSLRALREGDPAIADRGAEALALVDIARVDWRDLLWAGQLLAYALHRLDGDGAGVFGRAAALATGGTVEALEDLAADDQLDLVELGYREVETPDGIGFIADGGDDYAADADLVGIGLAISAGLDRDAWRLEPPEVGTSIAPVWLRRRPQHEVDQSLADVTGCTSLTGRIDRSVPDAGAQHLLVWVLETRTAEAARELAAAAGPGERGDFVAESAVRGRVCCIVIARSFVKDVAAYETADTIRRFGPIFEQALGAR